MSIPLRRPLAFMAVGTALLLSAGCSTFTDQDRATLNETKATADRAAADAAAAKASADRAAMDARASAEAARAAEAKADAAAASAKASAERSGRMYQKTLRK